MTFKQLRYDELGVTPLMVYQQMGYGDTVPTPDVVAETEEVMRMAEETAVPSFCFSVVPALPDFRWGKIIERQLQGAVAYAVFLCTAGEQFAQLQKQLKNDIVRSFIADVLGSIVAERTADVMERSLQETIDKLQWQHTNRFSPGYCGWHVSEQQRLFALFGEENPCHIRLTSSSLMLPEKSVSGVIGLGPDVRHLPYTCHLCDKNGSCQWSRHH